MITVSTALQREAVMFLLWIGLLTSFAFVQAIDEVCRKGPQPLPNGCNCTKIGHSRDFFYEILCDSFDGTVGLQLKVSYRPNFQEASIDCYGSTTLEKVPTLNLSSVDRLIIQSCPVPKQGFANVVDKLNLEKLDCLKLERLSLGNSVMTEKSFENLTTVTKLSLSSNDLSSIHPQYFANFPELTVLELNNNQLINLSREVFENLSKLERLEIMSNNISRLIGSVFLDLRALKKLYLWKNNLRTIENDTFEGLKNLTSLELSFNKIEDIHEDAFTDLENLVAISLRSNNVKLISKNHFKNNALLELVMLNENTNLRLPDDVFSNLKHLKEINIQRSNLTEISPNLFRNSTFLRKIDMSMCSIKNLPKDIFKDLENLQELQLAKNEISNLDDTIFNSLQNLRILDLRHNNLILIGVRLLQPLSSLTEINLSFNQISEIPNLALASNVKLVKFLMTNNRLEIKNNHTAVGPFNRLLNLEILDLGNNQISNFPEDVIMLFTKIRELRLNNNNIDYLLITSLWSVSSSLQIYLQHNKISRLDFTGVEAAASANTVELDGFHHHGKIPRVYLGFNPLICDCHALGITEYIEDHLHPAVKAGLDLDYQNLSCASPGLFQSIPIQNVKSSMLSCNLGRNCSDSDCDCIWEPFSKKFIVDCSSRNITRVPQITLEFFERIFRYNQTQVNLEGNSLARAPSSMDKGYKNVTSLNLANNRIETLHWIPPRIEVLDVHGNELRILDEHILQSLNVSSLQKLRIDDNPWKCDCETSHLTNFMRQNTRKIVEHNIVCNQTGKKLINLNKNDLCRNEVQDSLIVSVTLAIIFCIVLVNIALYYKFNQEIKVWLYAHNMCLWLVKEEELDKDKKYDAFISYSHMDEEFVTENLLPVLENGPAPYKLCLHFRNWIPGEFISTQVTNSVQDSRRTIVVLSKNFLESIWGKLEFKTAHTQAMSEGRARVIVLLYGTVEEESLDEELKTYMKTNTYIKWGDPWFWKKLRYALPHSNTKERIVTNNQKHANIMQFIDDKFSLMKSSSNQNLESTPPISMEKKTPLSFNAFDRNANVEEEVQSMC